MSLNFYSEIDSLQVTNKDEVVIKIKTSGSNLDKQIDELQYSYFSKTIRN